MNLTSSNPPEKIQDKSWPISVWVNDKDFLEELTVKHINEIVSKGTVLHFDGRIVQKYVRASKESEDIVAIVAPGSIVKGEGKHYYIMSDVSEDDKYSLDYRNCTGVIMTGIDKVSGNNISFMTHQDPVFFLQNQLMFEKDLKQKIDEIKNRAKPGSIDVILFGGWEGGYLEFDEYESSIGLLDKIITKELGKSPMVKPGPAINSAVPTNAYYETKNRQLYITRKESDFPETDESFVAKNVKEFLGKIKDIIENCDD
ncbi:MAG: hypothetical protein PHS92_04840 [Candidatus Gracilibacteria bacterium]|nr:hypothetical protein [Candidatus Gracilibacteria bacterium]